MSDLGSCRKDLESLWGIDFIYKKENDFIRIIPEEEKERENFPLSVALLDITQWDMGKTFHSFFEEEDQNTIINLWHSLYEEDKNKIPLLIFQLHDILYMAFQFTTGKSFFESFNINKNNIVVTYRLSKLPRVHNTIIIVEWDQFIDKNDTHRKRRYISRMYK